MKRRPDHLRVSRCRAPGRADFRAPMRRCWPTATPEAAGRLGRGYRINRRVNELWPTVPWWIALPRYLIPAARGGAVLRTVAAVAVSRWSEDALSYLAGGRRRHAATPASQTDR